MKDYYQTLGISKTATDAEIKQAYRKLAMQHHPDRGGSAEEFREIQQAYSILSDSARRQEYDQPQNTTQFSFNHNPFDFDTIFQVFGADLRRQQRMPPRVVIWISLKDVILGGPRMLNLHLDQTVATVEIEVPRGIRDNDNIRYPGIAPGGQDLIINYRITPDPVWQIQGQNLVMQMSVDLWNLILGCEVTIDDPVGTQLLLTIPSETQPGTVLRLKNKGLPDRQMPVRNADNKSGDLLIRLDARLQTPVDPAIIEAIRKFKDQ